MERPFGRGTLPQLGDLLTMVINHLLTGMILQVGARLRCKSPHRTCRRALQGHISIEFLFVTALTLMTDQKVVRLNGRIYPEDPWDWYICLYKWLICLLMVNW